MVKICKILMLYLVVYLNLFSNGIAADEPDISLLFVIDQSNRLSHEEFILEKQGFIDSLNTLPRNGRVEIASVAIAPNILSNFTQIASKQDLNKVQTALNDISRNTTPTNLSASMNTAINLLSTSSAQRKVLCLAHHRVENNPEKLQILALQAKNAEIVIVPIGLKANKHSMTQLENLASHVPTRNIQNFDQLASAIETECIAKVHYMLLNAVLTPLSNGIQPVSRTFTLGTQVNGNTVSDTSRYSVTAFDATSTLGGTVVDNGNLTFSYTLPTLFLQQDIFNYSVNDNTTGTNSNSMWMISPLVANADSATVKSEALITIAVLDNDANFSGDTIAINTFDANSTQGGTITNDGNNGLVYTSAFGFTGTDTFSYSAATSAGFSPSNGSATVTVTVTAANTTPIANNDTGSTTQENAVTIDNVLSNDTDADGDRLSISSADANSVQGGTVINNNDGTFLYTPPSGFTGSDSFNYVITDGQDTATATVTITVNIGNTAPVANNDTVSVSQNTSITITVLNNDSDADNDILSIKTVDTHSTQKGTLIKNNDNTISYTPAINFIGSDTFNYVIEDTQGETDTATVTISVKPPIEIGQGSNNSIDVLANEPNASVSINQTESTQGGSVTVDANTNLIRYTPAVGFSGIDTFTYTVTDQQGNTHQGTISIVVNAAPTANNDSAITHQETAIKLAILANDTDSENDTFFISHLDSTSLQTGTIVKNSDNTVTYTPALGFVGADSFSYSIQDTKGGTNTAIVSIKVNSLPIANEDSGDINQGETVRINVLANDTDLESSTLSVSLATTASRQGGRLSIDQATNSILYTPAVGFYGIDSFNYTVTDDSGGSSQGTVSIAVNAPPIASDDHASANKDSAVEINVLNNDSDADNDVLHISLSSQQTDKGGHIRVKDSAKGIIVYTPPLGFYSDTDRFSYTLTDSKGSTDTATVTVIVVSLVANNDAVTTTEGQAVMINVMENDIDSTDSISILSFDAPKKGQLIHNGGGNFTYTPKANFIGFDSFTYTVQTQSGTRATATVKITINGTGITTLEGGSMGINALLLLLFVYFIHSIRIFLNRNNRCCHLNSNRI